MKDLNELAENSVTDCLTAAPSTTRVFLDFRTACIGCRLARFCTLTDVVEAYRLDKAQFFKEISDHFVSIFNKENIQ